MAKKNKWIGSNQSDNRLRLLVIFFGIMLFFGVLLGKLYELQIVEGEFLSTQVSGTIVKSISLEAPRGNIYDKFGRPLAVNESSFTLNIDSSITVNDLNDVILKTINILEANNEAIVDNFPISEEPFEFLFNGSPSLEKTWKNDMSLNNNKLDLDVEDLTAEQSFMLLRDTFKIDEKLSNEDARKILMVRSELYQKRFSSFVPLTLAYDIGQQTISDITENSDDFLNIYVDVVAKRNYPAGNSFSHTLGYIRGINSEELQSFIDQGYSNYDINDVIGKDGIEKSFETTLKGTDGVAYYEVDNMGRKITEIPELLEPSSAGNDIFLTLDSTLNEVILKSVEETLRDVIVNRLQGRNSGINLTSREIYSAMANSTTIDISSILVAEEGSQKILRDYIYPILENTIKENDEKSVETNISSTARSILSKGVTNSEVNQKDIAITLFEQGILTDTENGSYVTRLTSGRLGPLQFLIEKLGTLEITPQMTGMLQAPASASVIVTDIYSGDVLASVSYPAYDNNRFVNTFDNAYYNALNTDPTSPMINRTFTEPRAPGSTFKMITALAGLETGVINTSTTIYDKDVFTDAGSPYPQCWIHGSHGDVDLRRSLEVSCNYYYYDLSYKTGISVMNEYMEKFGLNTRSGVEIYELYDSSALQKYPSKISSPDYKEYIMTLRNPDVSKYDLTWTAGDTVRTAIGQAYNNYTAAVLNKYMATLANGGSRYSLHFLDSIKDNGGSLLDTYEPVLEEQLNLSERNLQAIYDGMYAVTAGSSGTLRRHFEGFPVKVAAKSGTAEESRIYNDHNVFSGFAPYDDPQVAITVYIPYGSDSLAPAPIITKAILEEYLAIYKQPEIIYKNALTM